MMRDCHFKSKSMIYTISPVLSSTMRHQFDPIKTTKTSEVYRDPLVHQQRDDYLGSVNPVGSRTCDDACRDDDACDEGNRFAEALFFDDRRQHRLTIEAARIRNTFGPRMQRS